MPTSNLHRLNEHGQSVWVDSLSREMLETGELERLMREHAVTGVTSNPTIFQKALAEGDWYDEQVSELARDGQDDPELIFRMLAVHDIQQACDLMRPIWDATGGGDGYVSLEVNPKLARETEATAERAKLLWRLVDRRNALIKIPATPEGLPAIEEAIASGVSINITLIFSLERYAEVVDAYVRGLERLIESGGDPRPVASVASFFVSRVDTEVDKRLEAIGGDATRLEGKIAIANAKLAYQHYLEVVGGERWQALEAEGANRQRCLWASTSTKNPAYRDVMYVEELIGRETVNTMPLETIQAFQDHGEFAETLEQGIDEARKLFRDVEAAGVDLEDVWRVLEDEGVQKFVDSFVDLLDGVRAKRGELVGA